MKREKLRKLLDQETKALLNQNKQLKGTNHRLGLAVTEMKGLIDSIPRELDDALFLKFQKQIEETHKETLTDFKETRQLLIDAGAEDLAPNAAAREEVREVLSYCNEHRILSAYMEELDSMKEKRDERFKHLMEVAKRNMVVKKTKEVDMSETYKKVAILYKYPCEIETSRCSVFKVHPEDDIAGIHLRIAERNRVMATEASETGDYLEGHLITDPMIVSALAIKLEQAPRKKLEEAIDELEELRDGMVSDIESVILGLNQINYEEEE